MDKEIFIKSHMTDTSHFKQPFFVRVEISVVSFESIATLNQLGLGSECAMFC